MKILVSICVLVANCLCINFPAFAISQGESALGTQLVLGLHKSSDDSIGCSAFMITDQIVGTAAHCLRDVFDLNKPKGVYVTKPGAPYNSQDLVPVDKAMYVPTFGGWKYDFSYDIDDVAFLFLKDPLIPGYQAQIATSEIVNQIKKQQLQVTTYGYGFQRSNPFQLDGNPYYVNLQATENPKNFPKSPIAKDDRVLYTAGSKPGPAICGGDSGGPTYSNVNGINYLVSVISGGGGCDSKDLPAHGFTMLLYPHIDWVMNEFSNYKKNFEREKSIAQSKNEVTIYCLRGTKIKKILSSKPRCPKGFMKGTLIN